ncbi:MAG: adenylosuccinate synthetase [Nanoarchaeota archaeon]|nr:adenylosuccinate synthetase [Nanoarchaeota archaeon]
MPNTFAVGTYWGDEGIGKLVTTLVENNFFSAVVRASSDSVDMRFNRNVIEKDNLKYILGNGMIIDLPSLVDEIQKIDAERKLDGRLFISNRAHVIMPYHLPDDVNNLDPTLNPLDSCYIDKFKRKGIRLSLFCFPEELETRISSIFESNPSFVGDPKQITADYLKMFGKIKSFVGDISLILDDLKKNEKPILFEGALGTGLSADHGTYPYVTPIETCAGGICSGAGFGPSYVHKIVGVVKAYPTRAGPGPFPTEIGGVKSEEYCLTAGDIEEFEIEMNDASKLMNSGKEYNLGIALRVQGHEYAQDGRPRRIGWPDMHALNHARRVNGITELAVTKLDILSGMKEVRICTGYRIGNKDIEYMPVEEIELRRVKPQYITLEGWEGNIRHIHEFEDLPRGARQFIEAIEKYSGLTVTMIGTGPGKDDIIFRD